MTQPSSGDPTGQPDTPAEPVAPTAPPQDLSAGPSPTALQPPNQQDAAPRRRRGALIASITLAALLVVCTAGGVIAFLTLRAAEQGEGAEEPTAAVDEFLTAVYQDRDATKASNLVCLAARDDSKIAAKVAEVEAYAADYERPYFRWTPPTVDDQAEDRATVTTTVTMTTADEKTAELPLRLTVVEKKGWRVCEVAGG